MMTIYRSSALAFLVSLGSISCGSTVVIMDNETDDALAVPPPGLLNIVPDEPTPTICDAADWAPDDLALAITDKATLRLVRADGSHFTVDVGGADLPEEAHSRVSLNNRGDGFLAALNGYTLGNKNFKQFGRLTEFDRGGAILRTMAFEGYELQLHAQGADGSTIAHRYHPATFSDYVLISPTLDAMQPLPADFVPGSGPNASGSIRGIMRIDEENVPGWLDVATDVFSAISVAKVAHWSRAHRDGFVSLVDGHGGALLVRDLPQGTTSFALPAKLGDAASLQLRFAHGAPGLFVEQTADGSLWLIDPDSGTVRPVPAVLARDQTPLSTCMNPGPSFDSSQGFLIATRDAAKATIQRYDLENATWTPLGQPVTKVQSFAARERGGTYLLSASNEASFCPELSWEPPSAPVLSGETLQLVRQEDSVHRVLPLRLYTPAQLSRDGMCFAYPDDDGGIVVLDVLSGQSTRLALNGWFSWL